MAPCSVGANAAQLPSPANGFKSRERFEGHPIDSDRHIAPSPSDADDAVSRRSRLDARRSADLFGIEPILGRQGWITSRERGRGDRDKDKSSRRDASHGRSPSNLQRHA
jgi:hypothetical protein